MQADKLFSFTKLVHNSEKQQGKEWEFKIKFYATLEISKLKKERGKTVSTHESFTLQGLPQR